MKAYEPSKEIPAPGSPAAMKLDCSCPQMDNGFGKGAYEGGDGVPIYYITISCILHGDKPKKKLRKKRGEADGVQDKAKW